MFARHMAAVVVAILGCGAPAPVEQPVARRGRPQQASQRPAALHEPPPLLGIDSYRSSQVTTEQLLAAHEQAIRAFWAASADPAERQRRGEKIEAAIRRMGNFALVKLTAITGLGPSGPSGVYITIDLVDAADRATRMPFAEPPTETFEDPEGLLAAWGQYQDRFFELAMAGKVPARRNDCPAWHCIGDHTHADLKPLFDRFEARVPARRDQLAAILRRDRDPEHRASAAMLLAHLDDSRNVLELLLPAMRDPDQGVRNNAMRVISDMAMFHRDAPIPIEPFLDAIDFATATDRNKALVVLFGLVNQRGAAARRAILGRPAARRALLDILHLQQPNNHGHAYLILLGISGKRFAARDYEAWESWMESAARK